MKNIKDRLDKFQEELKGCCYFAYFGDCIDKEDINKCTKGGYSDCNKYNELIKMDEYKLKKNLILE